MTAPLDRLWNGWRASYVAESGHRDTGSGSVFTQLLASGLSDTDAHIVHRGIRCFALMNAFPYTSGHLLVLPYREVAELELLDDAETAELWSMVTDAVRVVKRAYRPQGVNVGINLGRAAGGSVAEHLHVHVVPRWSGDSNFITTVADARTLPEAIGHSAEKIRNAWLALPEP